MPDAGRLYLETGVSLEGILFGHPLGDKRAWGEVVFNTSMTGYEEIASDPSYAGQIVVMTYPLIGNYGSRDAFLESARYHCRALVVRRLSETVGHAMADRSLDEALRQHRIPCLAEVDTRALTRHIRDHGSIRGIIARADSDNETLFAAARNLPRIEDQELVANVSQKELVSHWTEQLPTELDWPVYHGIRSGRFKGLKVACLDLGVKRNQLRALASRGVDIVVFRHDATFFQIADERPDGIVISNGPGDPAVLPAQTDLVARLLDSRIPLLGICLGHQLVGRAIGAGTSRLPFGHHGGNHPVRNELTGAVSVTAQNHEFQVDEATIPASSGWYVSERNLNDDSVEGLRHRSLPAISVQYHPEGGPGPQDRADVFDEFLEVVAARAWSRELPTRAVARSRHTEAPTSILVIGSGPVIIGQAAEFDYAGTQACKALREEGARVILVNSNPATIMTDEETADVVYVEPLTVEILEKIICREQPVGLLPTLGGQTGLNLAVALDDAGILDKYGVRTLGTSLNTIRVAEDRDRFKTLLQSLGEPVPPSSTVSSLIGAREVLAEIGLPLVVRPAFTLGGTGGGLCETEDRFLYVVSAGLAASPIGQVLIERSLAGWREVEYEVMRDGAGTAITVCAMENIDPMGVHTGDSIVVAPTQTLTDREHQQLRSSALRIISALEIEGGCNVQFAIAPDAPDYFVIEVNPRVSRSSALASKATGYPIARVAAKVALGRRLDEIPNAITGKTTAAFEPALDYCVIKIPRWPFDKFPDADRRLGTQMKSTGEVMAIERTFEGALGKALRSLEQRQPEDVDLRDPVLLSTPNDLRLPAIMAALRNGQSAASISRTTGIGVWFLEQMAAITALETQTRTTPLEADLLKRLKRAGIADAAIADWARLSTDAVRRARAANNIVAAYKCVDTCAGEFAALTPYYYSTFEDQSEVEPLGLNAVIVTGSGPIRIGQGIEFDYCSVQAAQTLRRGGADAVMVNSNPETVSTDFDCSSRLYFEPLDTESVATIAQTEAASGVMTQFGGQTSINLAQPLERLGIPILGTGVEAINLAEDRRLFDNLLAELGVRRPAGGGTLDIVEAQEIARRIGFPVLVRPSFVLGGRGMEIIDSEVELAAYMQRAVAALPSDGGQQRRGTVLVDKYLVGREIDVDVVSDGEVVILPGLIEHIERSGVHSGDSMARYPARIHPSLESEIVELTTRIVRRLEVRGLCNLQVVVHDGIPYVIEVNPRASRTVPFLSKVTSVPMVELATYAARGGSLAALGWHSGLLPPQDLTAIKAPVFSTVKLDRVDSVLGPEMKSTGEVMGIDADPTAAIEKAFLAVLGKLPESGSVLCSISDADKEEAIPIIGRFADLGFGLHATAGTALALQAAGFHVHPVGRIGQSRPTVIDVIEEGSVALVINTVSRTHDAAASDSYVSGRTVRDGYFIRDSAERHRIPCCTSLDTASALAQAVTRQRGRHDLTVQPLTSYRKQVAATGVPPTRSSAPEGVTA
jgi:carbamoyl-phosphate synthase large subunit